MSLFGKVLRVMEFAHVHIAKRSIFDEKFLKVDHHRKEVAFHKKKHAKDNNQLVEQFSKSIESKTTNENSFRQLNSLLFLAKNQNDLDLVTNGIKHLLKEKQIPNNQIKGLASNLMRAVYVLNLPMKGLDYLRDKSLEPLFKYTGYPRVILMNRLMIEKKYEQVVELFEEYYKDGFRVDKEAVKSKPEPNKFFFPHDQFSLVTQALLKMDSPKALEKLKKIMDSIKLRKLEYCNLMVTRCFVLAIKQNDPEYALKLIKKFDNLDCTIGFNLTAIAFAKMKFINEALRTVQNIIDLNFEPDERKIHGKFFPFTIKSIQLALDHSKPPPPPILAEKLNLFKEMITNDKRFIPYDITDYIEKEYA